jgi:putative ABC transport system permease protein
MFRRTIRPACGALLAHPLRARLAVLSISIGVGAVVLTSAIGAGARQDILRRIQTMGTNLLIVKPVPVANLVGRKTIRGLATTLEIDDGDAIGRLPLIAETAPAVDRLARVKAANGSMNATVLGTTSAFPRVRRFRLREGRFFSEDDETSARRVAVLGARVNATLFQDGQAVGADIRVRGVTLDVIGVFEEKGVSADGGDEDSQVVIPLKTALRRLFNVDWLTTIFVSVRDSGGMDQAQVAVTDLIRARQSNGPRSGADDFAVQNTAKFLSVERQMADSLTTLTTGIAAVSLFTGATGILGLMLLAVRERRTEIGLRLAVGATPGDILLQFLSEATLLVVAGACVGIAMAALGAVIVAFSTSWTIGVPLDAVVVSVLAAVITGLTVGVFPARKAAQVAPIETLLAR